MVTTMQTVVDAKPWSLDPKVTPIPWRQESFEEPQTKRSLTVGVLLDDGVVRVHPPIERLLKELEGKLKAAGHEIVIWNSSGHKECIEIMVRRLFPWGKLSPTATDTRLIKIGVG
jgi:Asp-tRNA(Asn)/Glu-tRNA(Gln) amidotransferase A subunit family amidase